MNIRFKQPIYLSILSICIFAVMSATAKKINSFDISNSLVPQKTLVHGGPPRDSIPAIYNPHYVTVSEAHFMEPDDIVLGLEFQDHHFAFPRYILNWHELVNGQVGSQHFLVSYCPLCGSGMAFSSEVTVPKAPSSEFNKDNLIFGVSGILYNSDLVFYDKKTESLWSQIEGRAISGPYAGTELTQLDMQHTSWARWSNRHPKTKVLSERQGIKRNYRHDPYSGYDTSSQLFFKTLRKAPDDYHAKEKVLGVKIGDQQKAYPYIELRKTGLAQFRDQFAGKKYLVIWNKQYQTAHIEPLENQPELPVTTTAYWFAWYNFFPNTKLYRAP